MILVRKVVTSSFRSSHRNSFLTFPTSLRRFVLVFLLLQRTSEPFFIRSAVKYYTDFWTLHRTSPRLCLTCNLSLSFWMGLIPYVYLSMSPVSTTSCFAFLHFLCLPPYCGIIRVGEVFFVGRPQWRESLLVVLFCSQSGSLGRQTEPTLRRLEGKRSRGQKVDIYPIDLRSW